MPLAQAAPQVRGGRPPSMARPFRRINDPAVVPRTNKIVVDQVMSERKQRLIRDGPPRRLTKAPRVRAAGRTGRKTRASTMPQDHHGRSGGLGTPLPDVTILWL